MAVIEKKINGKKIILHSQHTIGRDKNNISLLHENDISRKHAIIYWENNCWQLTDYSSNGTKINTTHLNHTTKKLENNDLIHFSSAEEGAWKILNLAPPYSFLKPIDSNIDFIDLGKGLLIPKGNNPKWIFFQNKDQKWVMDDQIEERILIHKERYLINGAMYQFIENEILSDTLLNTDITKNACFQLRISIDEESITSKIKINDLEIDLGNRVFNHLLLHLARVKQQDLNFGLNDQLCGWVDMDDLYEALSKELLKEVDAYYVNTLIHRLRKNLINLPPYGFLFANIVERKKGKLRFGLPNFEIEKERALA